jgi:hypothetical protein
VGAPDKPAEEIEITPEMSAAGEDAIGPFDLIDAQKGYLGNAKLGCSDLSPDDQARCEANGPAARAS